MKLSTSPSKIFGVQLGDASINLLGTGTPLRGKFALLTKDGETCGFMEIGHGWSEKTLEALRTFSDALEEEALAIIMEPKPAEEATPNPDKPNEPPQF